MEYYPYKQFQKEREHVYPSASIYRGYSKRLNGNNRATAFGPNEIKIAARIIYRELNSPEPLKKKKEASPLGHSAKVHARVFMV